jgi:type III restriction enzyme
MSATSTCSSVSEILTEQTLGRGMRLPFGAYTDVEILDTLEVVAHERYAELLRNSGVLNEAFVDFRTRAVLRTNAQGQQVVTRETTPVLEPVLFTPEGSSPTQTARPTGSGHEYAVPEVTSVEDRQAAVTKASTRLKQEIARRWDSPMIEFPVLKMTAVTSSFSLADITETDDFFKLGRALATNPESELNRTLLGARVVVGRDGIKRTELVTRTGADRVQTIPTLFPIDELRVRLEDLVLGSPSVPARKNQRQALQRILDSFFEGLGDAASKVLSANLDRAGARLIRLIETEQRRYMAKPTYEEVVEVRPFDPKRATDKEVSADRFGHFSKSVAYEGWTKSTFPLVWFDSSPERTVANVVDDEEDVNFWVRLHIGDLPILWNSGGQNYNPDLLVVEKDGTHWVVEVKMDKEMESADVIGKRDAAKRWSNHVSADDRVGQWRYLLVSETDVTDAKGSWRALKQLAG